MPPRPRTPQWLDHKRQALKRRVAERLRAQPELLAIGRENLERWREPDGTWGRHTPYMETWMQAIDQGVEACCRILEDTSEDTQGLRQAAPFAGVLSEEERLRLLAELEAQP